MPPEAAAIEAEPLSSTQARRGFYSYLLLLAAPAIFFYILPILLVRLPSFESWGGTIYGPALDFGFHAQNQNADVVIFGDSSVLYGANPSLISAQLGLKVINLPNTLGSLPVTGDSVLARYLQHNRPPRLIVLYFSPWNLDYRSTETTQIFEGEEMLFRNGSLPEILAFSRKDPGAALLFPFEMYQVAPKVAVMAAIRRQDRVSSVRATMGHIDAQSFRAHISGPCTIPQRLVDRKGVQSVQLLAQRYASPQTRILVFVAPLPDCANAADVTTRSFADLSAAPPLAIPARYFLDDNFYAHVDPAAVPQVSRTLADAIQAAIR